MKEPQIPEDDTSRVASLCHLEVLDTPPEERFDRLTAIAQAHFKVPITLVSLVDNTRQWFKSRQGLDALETPRNISFCGHAILSDEILVIPDTLKDERFADNPLVTDAPNIRFYAGAPLKAPDGEKVGTLCIIDRQPRDFTNSELSILRYLADAVEGELGRLNLQSMQKELLAKDERLSIENERLALATKAGEIGIWEYIVPTNELKWDHRMFELYGIKREQFPGEYEAWSSALHPADMARSEQELNDAIAGGKAFDSEFRVIWPNGEVHHIQAHAAVVFDSKNNPVRMIGINQDITERKKIEKLKNDFVSTVSHELRTPLTSIRGALGLIMGKFEQQLPKKVTKMLTLANRNAERLTLLINDILDLEKIESGSLEFEFLVLDLVGLARQAVEDNAGFADKHQVKLVFLSTLKEAMVQADQHRLLQVFSNLISNAVKYSNQGGTVEITVEQKDYQYVVSVQDYGPGIPKAFEDRIFQRFAQADTSNTREKGGTGLGLSITKAIVERHYGHIDYTTEKDKGTCFYFSLPGTSIHQMPKSSSQESISALVCEGNADVAKVLVDMLKIEGISGDIASTGAQTYQMLLEGNYRVLLMDLSLPDEDGLKTLDKIQSNEKISRTPIIVVSGQAQKFRSDYSGQPARIVDWIQKPVEQDRLSRSIKVAVNRSRKPHILHIEDDTDIVQVTQNLVGDLADFSFATSLKEARQSLKSSQFDLVILDLVLSDGSGLDLLDDLQKNCPVVIFSVNADENEEHSNRYTSLSKMTTSKEKLRDTIVRMLKERSHQ